MRQRIAIYGTGGFGREVGWLVQSFKSARTKKYELVCYIDDNVELQGKSCDSIPVVSLSQAGSMQIRPSVVCGIGDPLTKEAVVGKTMSAGFKHETLIHPTVQHSDLVIVGEGSVICTGGVLTTNVDIGRHVHVNLNCTIGHDVIIGDYTTVSPGVHISGCVQIGKRVFIGSGAVIINGTAGQPITVGDDVIIAAGACVIKSIPSGQTVAGVPAKPLRYNKHSDQYKSIKQNE